MFCFASCGDDTQATPDAAMPDGATHDAPMIDAPMIDAPAIDAPAIDAPMPDAAMPDAAAPTCNDNMQNGLETDVDCGGAVCDGMGLSCADGKNCLVQADCRSGVCNSSHQCAAPRCNDGVLNGSETDRDCGGPVCAPCGNGLHCLANSDCISGNCSGNRCQ